MTILDINTMSQSSALTLYTDRDKFQLDPDYQRQSDIWSLEKRQLLIDSIVNGFDIPKLYFHKFSKSKRISNKEYSYAIIDGKQRLESIWGFIDGGFVLSDAAEYVRDPKLDIAGLSYNELGQKFPGLKAKFDSFTLNVVVIETDDKELIEDMFSRLNEAVPLSAAEKRNALGGPIPKATRKLVSHKFFKLSLPFGNTRYRHFDLAAKFYLITDHDQIVDTKKVYLDDFVEHWKDQPDRKAGELDKKVRKILSYMERAFVKEDSLLRSVGMITVYYHLFRIAHNEGWAASITRKKLEQFEKNRATNRNRAAVDVKEADYDLLEFDRLVQTPNDAYATEIKLKTLMARVFKKKLEPRHSDE